MLRRCQRNYKAINLLKKLGKLEGHSGQTREDAQRQSMVTAGPNGSAAETLEIVNGP